MHGALLASGVAIDWLLSRFSLAGEAGAFPSHFTARDIFSGKNKPTTT